MKHKYTNDFYKDRDIKTSYSAQRILQIVQDNWGGGERIHSAVDIGCGVGTWLKQVHTLFQTDDIQGYDGDYVDTEYLVIPKECFCPFDLEKEIPQIRRFDLAISLEVAEHLSPQRAESFVKDLCTLSDNILFSAATVYQGGVGHINEQRLSYWVDKFSKLGYEARDIIRPKIWEDTKIPVWYRQNIIFFSKNKAMSYNKSSTIIDIVHPELYETRMALLQHYNNKIYFKVYFIIRNFLAKIWHKIK